MKRLTLILVVVLLIPVAVASGIFIHSSITAWRADRAARVGMLQRSRAAFVHGVESCAYEKNVHIGAARRNGVVDLDAVAKIAAACMPQGEDEAKEASSATLDKQWENENAIHEVREIADPAFQHAECLKYAKNPAVDCRIRCDERGCVDTEAQ
jgi:hypothetical protein